MGMDTIGYLVKGPRTLDRSKRTEAISYAEHVHGRLTAFWDREEALPAESEYDEDDIGLIGYALARPSSELGELVDNLFDMWESGAHDMAYRVDPDDANALLIFAGEGSWGDEPEGWGYTTLRDARTLGLFPVFGIR